MTDQLSPLAVQNGPLLRALKEGRADGPSDLAARAGIVPNHVHRKLEALEGEGLIVRPAEGPRHVATLTEAAEKALLAIDVYEGRVAAGEDGGDVTFIPLVDISRWPQNPRRHFSDVTVMEMAQSIADKGVLQPLVVRRAATGDETAFHVVIGERRWRGANLAVQEGWLPADFKVPCRIRDYTDTEALEVAGVENLQREDLHWMDEAQFYLNLMNAGRSASEIERIVGGTRGKRSIQDYAKIARELSADDVGRTYLDEKHPNYLPYVRARDLVGDKKERPALDLTPKLRLTLLELIASGNGDDTLGRTIITRLHKPPVGGPLDTLSSQRKLIAFGFENREVVCRIKVSDDLAKYLQQVGWYDDAAACLRTAREAVVGEMQVATLEPGEFLTPELNAPKPTPAAPQAALTEPQPSPQAPPAQPYIAPPADGDDEDGDDEPVLPPTIHQAPRAQPAPNRQDEAPAAGPAPTPVAAPVPAETPSLPPMLQIVLIELAHRVSTQGAERGPGTWGTEVLANYHRDQRGLQLVQHRMIAFLPMGHKTLATVTKRGLDWLQENVAIGQSAPGRPEMSDAALMGLQRELGFTPEAGAYATAWLNDPAPEPQAAEPEAAQPEPAPPPEPTSAPPRRDVFAQQVLAVTAENRALHRTAAALREARNAISIAKSMKLTAAQVTKLHQLIDGALEAAAPHLTDQSAA